MDDVEKLMPEAAAQNLDGSCVPLDRRCHGRSVGIGGHRYAAGCVRGSDVDRCRSSEDHASRSGYVKNSLGRSGG
jgi:hypothetical protein